jgi:hypothetical protein
MLALFKESRRPLSDELRRPLLELLATDDVRPDSLIYLVGQQGTPVRDMTVDEVTFLRSGIRDETIRSWMEEYETLLKLWREALEEHERNPDGPTPKFGNYERALADFVDRLGHNDAEKSFSALAQRQTEYLGNPWLSYGRPLNGYPITIDTQFDDVTIIEHIKAWLSVRRRAEESRARRPFNQSDYDDWEYYKVREVFDLQTWAEISDVKVPDRLLAAAVWPNASETFSPIDVLRTTARKKVDEVFRFETAVRLYGQLRLARGENFLID